jgi:phosphoesterase RecJ-like protein
LTVEPSLLAEFQNALRNAKSVLIGTHLNPDGDALGSALALSHYLWAEGIKNEVLCNNPPPANLQFLPGANQIRQEPISNGHDLAVILDLETIERLGRPAQYFTPIPKMVVIDHHVPHEKPGDIRIVDVSASATAVILARILEGLGAKFTPEIAICLLTGIVTDTGSFRFRNTNPESLLWAAKMLEAGADINVISEEVFQRKPRAAVELLGRMLEKMVLASDDRVAYASISHEDFESIGALDEHTEGFVNELLSIQSVQVAALMREAKPGRVRVSLRSRGDVDVAKVAQELGGGGHRNAAGISFDMPLQEVEDLLVPRLFSCLESF